MCLQSLVIYTTVRRSAAVYLRTGELPGLSVMFVTLRSIINKIVDRKTKKIMKRLSNNL
jgi:hypothetical protein